MQSCTEISPFNLFQAAFRNHQMNGEEASPPWVLTDGGEPSLSEGGGEVDTGGRSGDKWLPWRSVGRDAVGACVGKNHHGL